MPIVGSATAPKVDHMAEARRLINQILLGKHTSKATFQTIEGKRINYGTPSDEIGERLAGIAVNLEPPVVDRVQSILKEFGSGFVDEVKKIFGAGLKDEEADDIAIALNHLLAWLEGKKRWEPSAVALQVGQMTQETMPRVNVEASQKFSRMLHESDRTALRGMPSRFDRDKIA